MPKISVIIPVFRTEAYLETCVRSVMAQTFEDLEILCVDDASPDGSLAILERLAGEDPRIQILRHPTNRGLGAALNTGLGAARGSYIGNVDSDDRVSPEMFQKLWTASGDGHFDVVVCGYVRVAASGKVLSRSMGMERVLDPPLADMNPFHFANPAVWNKLWRRDLFSANNISFPHNVMYHDLATTPRLFSKARSICYIKDFLYFYLSREDAMTNTRSDTHLVDYFRTFDVLKDHFEREGRYDAGMREIFADMITRSFRFHAMRAVATAKASEIHEAGIGQYLRHLLLMRDAYLADDDRLRSSGHDAILAEINAIPGRGGAS